MKKFIPKNPSFKRVIADVLTRQFFMKHVRITLVYCEPAHVLLKLDIEEIHLQQAFALHGGVIATIADIAMGFSALTLAPAGKGMVTSNLNLSFIRKGVGKTLWAKAKVIKEGNLLTYCKASIYTTDELDTKTVIAKSTATMCSIAL